jgi:hypothetical protein
MLTLPRSLGLSGSFAFLSAVLVFAGPVFSPVQAQPASSPMTRPDPLNPQARVPAVVYTSPMSSYRRLGEDKRVPWVEANENVTRIGGWRTYTREAQQPEPAATAPQQPARAPIAAPTTPASPTPAPARRSPHQH